MCHPSRAWTLAFLLLTFLQHHVTLSLPFKAFKRIAGTSDGKWLSSSSNVGQSILSAAKTRNIALLKTRLATSFPSNRGPLSYSVTADAAEPLANYTKTFEVAVPIQKPTLAKECTVKLYTNQNFSNQWGVPVKAPYEPPTDCGQSWSKLILTMTSNVKGRQFDRVHNIYFEDFEISRSITAEPTAQGVIYGFEQDVTAFAPAFRKAGNFTMTLTNVVDETYTGIFYVSLSLTFYSGPPDKRVVPDAIIPLVPAVDKWMVVLGDNKTADGTLSGMPTNIVRAELNLLPSHHANDEFYYTALIKSYFDTLPADAKANNLRGTPFRDISVAIDGKFVGSVMPYPLFYTGAMVPTFWKPVVGIGCFPVPSYTLELTPFIELLNDGQQHTVSVSIPKALDGAYWPISASLRVWRDPVLARTTAKTTAYTVSPLQYAEKNTTLQGFDAQLQVSASRQYSFSGVVTSSKGEHTVTVSSSQQMSNAQMMKGNLTAQNVRHNVQLHTKVTRELPGGITVSSVHSFDFPLTLIFETYTAPGNGSYYISIDHAYNVKEGGPLSNSTLTNTQFVEALIYDDGGVVGGEQHLSFEGLPGGCYKRDAVTGGGKLVTDTVSTACGEGYSSMRRLLERI